jgi:predicted O-methyltransferase YrrM
MDLIAEPVTALLNGLVPERPLAMRHMEQRARDNGFPIIGPAAGHFCYLVARMIGARSVFELGSGFGYSTAWFARAVTENGGGTVDHVVWDETLSADARAYMAELGHAGVVRFTVGEAIDALRAADGPFDMVFCDIDKKAYPAALDVIATKLRPGGVLITDNVLWSGRIFDESDDSPDTEAIREYTRRVSTDPGWSTTIVPIRDGLAVSIRNG